MYCSSVCALPELSCCVNLSLRSQSFAIGEIRGACIGILSRPAMAFGLVWSFAYFLYILIAEWISSIVALWHICIICLSAILFTSVKHISYDLSPMPPRNIFLHRFCVKIPKTFRQCQNVFRQIKEYSLRKTPSCIFCLVYILGTVLS